MPYQSAPSLKMATRLVVAAAMALTGRTAAAGELWAVSQVLDQVYVIDTTTGAATLMNDIPPADNVQGIAFDAAGAMWGVANVFSEDLFWSIDKDAGSATLIGGTGDEFIQGALACDPTTGIFYSSMGIADKQLVTIDPSTGLATYIGTMTSIPPFTGFAGMTFLPDGTLLGYVPEASGDCFLYSIDKTAAVATLIGFIANIASLHGGLAYDSDTETLYMSGATTLWTVDVTTGEGTLVGPHVGIGPDLINGLTILPDPEQSCMLGVDLFSTMWDIDPLTGAGTNPRVLGTSKFGGLAMSSAGDLFGMRAAPIPELYSIEQASGLTTLIGPLGILHAEGGLDFQPSTGELFGVGGTSDLFQIDTTTGTATIVGPLIDELGDPIDPSAMAFDDAGTLFVLKAASAPPEIYQVDPVDGTVLDRVPLPGLPLAFFAGMDFDDTTGFLHLTYGDILYRANPYTGATLLVGPTPLLMSALELIGPCDPPPPGPRPLSPRPARAGVGSWTGGSVGGWVGGG